MMHLSEPGADRYELEGFPPYRIAAAGRMLAAATAAGSHEMRFSMSATGTPATLSAVFWLIRADDQLVLEVRASDLTLKQQSDGSGYVLEPSVIGGQLTVELPPQHCMEPANTAPGPWEQKYGPKPAFGRDTRLVFRVERNTPPIPFTVEGILAALPTLGLVVDSDAGRSLNPLPAPPPHQPAAAILAAATELRTAGPAADGTSRPDGVRHERSRRSEARLGAERVTLTEAVPAESIDTAVGALASGTVTGLRLPSRLTLTPLGGATAFTHAARAVTRDGRTELWHTRLARLRADGRLVEVSSPLVALETDELDRNEPPWSDRVGGVLDGALTSGARQLLVKQTKDRPLSATQLMLSGFGAWLDAKRDFGNDDSLKSYLHQMAMGRDITVRSVRKGWLYPFGHEAILVGTTERQFSPDNGQLATLGTRWLITVRQSIVTYRSSHPAERAWPWHSVRLLTMATPSGERTAFAPGAQVLQVGGAPVTFRCLAVDRGGRITTFELPLVFVDENATNLAGIVNTYRRQPAAFRTAVLAGQTVSVAQPTDDAPEATDVVADSIVLNLHSEQEGQTTVVRATTDSLTGKLPSLQKFVPELANKPLALTYASAYVSNGFGAGNAGQLVLQLAGNQSVPLLDLADKAVTGGLVTPKFSMNAISRLTGPVGGDLAKLATGKVKVADLLKQAVGEVKLLGVFPLVDLLGKDLELELAAVNPARRVPQLITEALDGISVSRLHWGVELFKGPGVDPVKGVPAPHDGSVDIGPVRGTLSALGAGPAKLIIDVVTELAQPVNPAAPKMRTRTLCRVENIKLTMGAIGQDLVTVPFKHISFETRDGAKLDFDADLGKIEFFGVLAFVRTLAALCPQDAFSDPPALDITDEKISSSIALPVPAAAVGMFSLENITFSAALDLWFAQPPTLSLNFATFDNRFRLAVLCLGGGGYVGVRLSTRGLERLEGALEFGASVSVNLVVAKAAVSIMGGIHFAYDRAIGPVLSGYVEVRGEVEVLCLVEVGVSLLVMLAYNFQTGELSGRAQLEVRVKVLFITKTVRVPFKYTFVGGSDGSSVSGAAERRALAGGPAAAQPGFLDQMAPKDWPAGRPRPWDTYCLAFA